MLGLDQCGAPVNTIKHSFCISLYLERIAVENIIISFIELQTRLRVLLDQNTGDIGFQEIDADADKTEEGKNCIQPTFLPRVSVGSNDGVVNHQQN